MALSQLHRTSIRRSLSPLLGEEEADALLAQFPQADDDELVTRSFLRAEMAELRGEMADLRGELRTEMADLRGDLHLEMAALQADIAERMRQQVIWLVGAMCAILTAAVAVSTATAAVLR